MEKTFLHVEKRKRKRKETKEIPMMMSSVLRHIVVANDA